MLRFSLEGDPSGRDWRYAQERSVRALTTGYWIDLDRWAAEVAYARTLSELTFIRRVSDAANDRDLRRSTALRNRLLLFLDAMPTFDYFSFVDSCRSLQERTLEHACAMNWDW